MKKHIVIIILSSILLSCNNKDTQLDAYGHFEAVETYISSELSGKLISLNFRQGDFIESGDTIAIVDTSSLSVRLSGFEVQEAAVMSKIPVLKAQKKVFESELSGLENEFERALRLKEGGAVSSQQYEKLEYQLKTAKAKLATFPSQINSVYREIEVIRSQAQLVQDQINKAIVCSMSDVTVLEKYINPGEMAVPAKPILKVANMKDMFLRAYISGQQLSSFSIGQTVSIRFDVAGGEYEEISGVVSWVADQAEFTPKIIQTKEERVNLVYAIKVRVLNTGELKIGMPGELILNQ